MKILLVEPDYVLSDVYSRSLSKAKHDVVVKSSAQGAVDAMNSESIDLIILEIQMAGHNGLEFLHELRSYSEWQKVPIVVLTLAPRSSFQVEEKQFKNLGVVNYLYKPVTTSANLIDAVDLVSTE